MTPYLMRFVEHSLFTRLDAFLDAAGWKGPNVPFKADPVVPHEATPRRSDLEAVQGNEVWVSFGDEPAAEPQEMGGGIVRIGYPFFVDVVGKDEATAKVIAMAVKSFLSGEDGSNPYYRPVDMVSGEQVPGVLVEVADVMRSPKDMPGWQVVDGMLLVDFPGEIS